MLLLFITFYYSKKHFNLKRKETLKERVRMLAKNILGIGFAIVGLVQSRSDFFGIFLELTSTWFSNEHKCKDDWKIRASHNGTEAQIFCYNECSQFAEKKQYKTDVLVRNMFHITYFILMNHDSWWVMIVISNELVK